MLASAAAVESTSEHPLAKAIVAAARRTNIDSITAADFKSLPGRGAAANVQGRTIAIGGPRLLAESKLRLTPEFQQTTRIWAQEGKTVLYVLSDGAVDRSHRSRR
jgi:Cu2+-exporting ATPase